MWPNCLKYRQGRSVSCGGFCLLEVSRLETTSLWIFQSHERVRREMSGVLANSGMDGGETEREGVYYFLFNGGCTVTSQSRFNPYTVSHSVSHDTIKRQPDSV